ncbi:MAG: hypothetical protein JKY27_04195 [Magnetovibrio sp.]|nr:hypothetical protein [Magnetovibrio sp.]
MIELITPNRDLLKTAYERAPARMQRDDELKQKVGYIIKKHPNKSLSVIRRWLHNDQV